MTKHSLLPIVLRKCYTIGVRHFDKILSEAVGNNGIFTYRAAKALGIRSPELSRWMKMGRIAKVGHGVYRLLSYPAQGDVTDRAALLAEVGEDSFLWGETALGFLGLCPVRSYVAYVASPHRIRRRLPEGVIVKSVEQGYRPFYPEGVACQRVGDAICASVGTVELERLHEAIATAEEKGLLGAAEASALKKKVNRLQSH